MVIKITRLVGADHGPMCQDQGLVATELLECFKEIDVIQFAFLKNKSFLTSCKNLVLKRIELKAELLPTSSS